MMHTCIVGMTGGGKSYLAKALCRERLKRGGLVFVLESVGDEWDCTRQYSDPMHFLAVAQANERALLVVDEADENCGRNLRDPELRAKMEWLPRRSRHKGHQCLFIMQNATAVHPVFREMCTDLFLFRVAQKQADHWADQFVCDELRTAPSLEQYYFLKANIHGQCQKMKV